MYIHLTYTTRSIIFLVAVLVFYLISLLVSFLIYIHTYILHIYIYYPRLLECYWYKSIGKDEKKKKKGDKENTISLSRQYTYTIYTNASASRHRARSDACVCVWDDRTTCKHRHEKRRKIHLWNAAATTRRTAAFHGDLTYSLECFFNAWQTQIHKTHVNQEMFTLGGYA